MLDNQTRMRSMLDLIESVDQGKKIKLNEGIGGALTGGAIGSMIGGLPGAAVGAMAGGRLGNVAKSLMQNKNDAVIQALTEKLLNPTSLSVQPKRPTLSPEIIQKLYPGLIGSMDTFQR